MIRLHEEFPLVNKFERDQHSKWNFISKVNAVKIGTEKIKWTNIKTPTCFQGFRVMCCVLSLCLLVISSVSFLKLSLILPSQVIIYVSSVCKFSWSFKTVGVPWLLVSQVRWARLPSPTNPFLTLLGLWHRLGPPWLLLHPGTRTLRLLCLTWWV